MLTSNGLLQDVTRHGGNYGNVTKIEEMTSFFVLSPPLTDACCHYACVFFIHSTLPLVYFHAGLSIKMFFFLMRVIFLYLTVGRPVASFFNNSKTVKTHFHTQNVINQPCVCRETSQ